jgi:hypothetical protein
MLKLRIPRRVVAAVDAFRDWGYTPIYRHPRFTLRRIDPWLAAAFLLCTGYYGWIGGWLGALTGALAFTIVVMCTLWF